MRYGLVVDNRRCIGCHACTVACKTENRVPLGVNRTWVKYVEKGRYPEVRRFFQVTRCNHCERPPCVTICPVGAMYQRRDGIVDFDPGRCLGCKACMQACPYDAIYVDPDSGTAAKCHFCAHRAAVGLLPACAAACPERALIVGDLDQPEAEISRLVARQGVRVRKPEQGTRPKVYYVDAEESAIVPTAARHETFYLWAERDRSAEGAAFDATSPLLMRDARVAYDVAHFTPWDWRVPLYFWLKSLGAGLLILPALALLLGWLGPDVVRDDTLALLALVFMGATTALLIADLGRPERFWRVLLTPRWGSWLSRGAVLLPAYSAACGLFWLTNRLGATHVSSALLAPTAVLGALTAAYTAFLFGQCEGRDLWQTPLLPLHLVVQALLASAAGLALLPLAFGGSPAAQRVAAGGLGLSLVLHLLIVLGECAMPHTTDNAAYAARLLTRGPYRHAFWGGAVALGGLVPALLLGAAPGSGASLTVAALLALGGLLVYEWCFVMAGQRVPNS